jgi:hypothetical protein
VSEPQVIECAFEVYASRLLGVDELATLRLTDSVGTEYERIDPDEVIEGQGSLVFRPALPSGANLHLSQPGWGLRSATLETRD